MEERNDIITEDGIEIVDLPAEGKSGSGKEVAYAALGVGIAAAIGTVYCAVKKAKERGETKKLEKALKLLKEQGYEINEPVLEDEVEKDSSEEVEEKPPVKKKSNK